MASAGNDRRWSRLHGDVNLDAEEERALAEPLDFERFFTEEHDRLYRALCLVTRNRFEAEEILQDAFLAMWERWDRILVSVDDPTAYLYRTAMNGFRRRRRRALVAARKALGRLPGDDGLERIEAQGVGVEALPALH